jgi:hypothetical protein
MKHATLTLFAVLLCSSLHQMKAQSDSTGTVTYTAYAEAYYSYDFGNPANHERPPFMYCYRRHNELNVNFMYGKVTYESSKYRANAAIQFGNYVDYNMAAEPGSLKNIYEANVGVKLSKKHNLWLDAGVMPSHLDFESAISANCLTLTRSLAAENSPYYETGVKLSYTTKNEKFSVALLALNGWQRIRRLDYMNNPAGGTYVQYNFSPKLHIVYTNFVGSDKPDSLNALRVFNDVYLSYTSKKTEFIIGYDIGEEKRADGKFNTWYTPQIVSRFRLTDKAKLALRAEYYNDKDQVIIYTGSENGFQVLGASAGLDYYFSDRILLRVEAKYYNSKDRIFFNNKSLSYDNYCATSSLSVRF